MTSKILRNDQNIYSSMYVKTYKVMLTLYRKEHLSDIGHFRDWYAVASLRYGNRAVLFWCRRESYLV